MSTGAKHPKDKLGVACDYTKRQRWLGGKAQPTKTWREVYKKEATKQQRQYDRSLEKTHIGPVA